LQGFGLNIRQLSYESFQATGKYHSLTQQTLIMTAGHGDMSTGKYHSLTQQTLIITAGHGDMSLIAWHKLVVNHAIMSMRLYVAVASSWSRLYLCLVHSKLVLQLRNLLSSSLEL
jgi:hypothetical protein